MEVHEEALYAPRQLFTAARGHKFDIRLHWMYSSLPALQDTLLDAYLREISRIGFSTPK